MPRPNFFLIGPPKTGTTAVAKVLSRHPEIFVSEPKEPNFFVYQGGNPYGWNPRGKDSLDWYLGIFARASSRAAIGDASPYYICCGHCATEIHRFNPDARIVAILRNPVYRAFSMYRYWHTNSAHAISAADFVDSFMNEKLVRAFERGRVPRVGWLKDIGFYARHLKAYYDVFPAGQIRAVFYDQLVNDPDAFYRTIYEHLDVTPAATTSANTPVNVTVERRSKSAHRLLNKGYYGPVAQALKASPAGALLRQVRGAINAANVKPDTHQLAFPQERYNELIAVYGDDIAALEELLGVSLDGWRSGEML